MKCGSHEQFEEGAQVFFCYGRLSNRQCLLRYGFALQHNKYDHVHMKVNLADYLVGYRGVQQQLA